MGWWKYNDSTKLFEYSTNNGASFASPGLDAAIITQGTIAAARLPVASASTDGIINQVAQTIAGAKTFNDIPILAGGGIKFPATQIASSDANTLDDYEEGTWTPTIAFGGASVSITYSIQTGTYIKIGQLVFFAGRVALTNKGSSTGGASINALPFALHASYYSFMLSPYHTGMATLNGLNGLVNAGGTTISLTTEGAASHTSLQETNFTNTSDIIFGGVYRASA